jgi:hypothetical protein
VEKIKILILSANPKDSNRLRLDEEVRRIELAMERARSRDWFEIIPKAAVQVEDLRRSLLDHNPQIVHFSGHGEAEGLVLETATGTTKLVTAAALARLFKAFQRTVRCVVLNACYSEAQAQAIRQHIPFVVGMNQAIGDRAAIEFATGFYDGLGAGRTIEDSFEMGCATLDLESIPEAMIPVLLKPEESAEALNGSEVPQNGGLGGGSERLEPPVSPAIAYENPEGQVPLESAFYVDRPPIEGDCYDEIIKPGALIRVKAPRQMGKTSLMSRLMHVAEAQHYQTVCLNLQLIDAEYLASLDLFLQWFCVSIADALNLPDQLEDYWKGVRGAKTKCTNYFQKYLLTAIDSPIALGLDEVDEVFKHPEIAQGFFGLLRAWHEQAKNDPLWKKLRLVIAHSKEVYIPLNINQSPFNVGLPIELPPLTQAQVQLLAERHGLVWQAGAIAQVMQWFGGHPYLVRAALYQIARQRMTLEHLVEVAAMEEDLYGDHLRRHLLNLEEDEDLLMAMKRVVVADKPVDVGSGVAFKLRSMGLVRFQENAVVPACDLYRQYFRDRLGVN